MRKAFVILTVLAALVVPAAAFAGFHATDPTGDSGAAPDITTVDVSNDSAGNITFNVGFVQRTLASDEALILAINSDANAATGNSDGTDVYFFLDAAGWSYHQWNGSQFAGVQAPAGTNVTLSTTNFTVTVNKATLGNTSKFTFYVQTDKGPGASTDPHDSAPDGTAVYVYSLATVTTLTWRSTGVAGSTVHAGKGFSVTGAGVKLSDGTAANADSFTCKATLGGKALPSAGRCAWRVPKKAAGKSVVLTLTVGYGGSTYTTKITLHVKK